jgi:hypothetical protein
MNKITGRHIHYQHVQNPKSGCENLLQGSINRDTCLHLFLYMEIFACK